VTADLLSRLIGALPPGSGASGLAQAAYRHGLLPCETRVCRLRAGAKVALDLNVEQEATAFLMREWEASTWRYLARNLQPGDTLLDVGANIGLMLLQVRAKKRIEVHAFEPSAATADRLRRNIDMNGWSDITVVQVAVSDRPGVLALSGDNPVTRHVSRDGEQVTAITLDEYVAERHLDVHALKLDVEGYEPAVIQGARHLLVSQKPLIISEVIDAVLNERGFERRDLIEPLRQLHYEPRPLPPVMLQRLRRKVPHTENVAFVSMR